MIFKKNTNSENNAEIRSYHERAHSNNIVQRADRIWGYDSAAGQYRVQRKADMIAEHAALTVGMKVLEIGCGTGEYTGHFLKTGASICTVDVSHEMVKIARQKAGDTIQYFVSDVIHLSFADSSFDAVVGNAILHHLPKSLFPDEISRVLRPGGRAVFTEPNMLNPLIFLQKCCMPLKIKMGDSPDEMAFYRWELVTLMSHAGLNTKVYNIDFLPPRLPKYMLKIWSTAGLVVEKLPILRELSGNLLVVASKPKVRRLEMQ